MQINWPFNINIYIYIFNIFFLSMCCFFARQHNMLPCDIRYGPIFKTSLVGQPVIISADPELNHFVLQQEGRLFQSWYPDTFQEVFGRQSMGFIHGLMYKYLKSLILSLFSGKSLKENILSEINQFARRTLISWSAEPSIEFKDASSAVRITSTIWNS